MKIIVAIFLSEKKMAFSLKKGILLLIKIYDKIIMLSDNICCLAEDVLPKIILISVCIKTSLYLALKKQAFKCLK